MHHQPTDYILSGVAMRWAKSRGPPTSAGAPEFQAFFEKNDCFPVTVRIRTSGYQTLECFTATLPTGRLVHVGETCNRLADFGL